MTDAAESSPETDESAALQAAQDYVQRSRIERFRILSVEQKNPLYVWQAILHCNAYGYPIPDWCLSYIEATAIEIQKLIMAASTWAYTKKQSHIFEATMTPKDAAASIPQAMQIIQNTRNAFERMAADRDLMNEAEEHNAAVLLQGLENPPFTVADVEKAIQDRRNVNNLRVVRTRVKKGKALLKKAGHANIVG